MTTATTSRTVPEVVVASTPWLNHPIRLHTGKTVPLSALLLGLLQWLQSTRLGDPAVTRRQFGLQHDQQTWGTKVGSDCGTAACFAGFLTLATKGSRAFSWSQRIPGSVAQPTAAGVLGLPPNATMWLFDGGRKRSQLIRAVEHLLAGGGHTLMEIHDAAVGGAVSPAN